MFGRKTTVDAGEAESRISAHVEEVIREAVDSELMRLNKGRETEHAKIAAENELLETKKNLVDLKLNFDREQEKHERLTREIEHKVGLHKKQVEHEIVAARKESELNVKEKHLEAEKDRFEKEIAFMRERFETEVGYLREMMGEVLNRLPEVKVERTYTTEEHIGQRPNGREKELAAGPVEKE